MASWGQNQWGQQAAGFDANAYGQQLVLRVASFLS
jgi:hypothetical protein